MTSYVVWTNSSVEKTLDRLDPEQRRSFDRACDILKNDPYPRGTLIWKNVRVQQRFYS
jgi:mRNA-degrading endonuclease RelE of RelBE toxin-antitoxin system